MRSDRGFFVLLVVLVGVLSYGLGLRAGQAVPAASQPAIVFTAAPTATSAPGATPVVASRGGTKYHRLDCPGADTIKDSNKIYFDSSHLARAAGYLPAGNCKGLE